MTRKVLLILLGATSLCFHSTGLCQQSVKIGYVSLKKLSDESKKKKAFEEEVKKLAQVDIEKRDALRQQIKDLETALTLSGPDQARKTEDEIARKRKELERLIEERNARIQRRSLVFEKEILEDIAEAVREVAEERGYGWVLVDEILLHKDESADLTYRVLVKMNDKYAAERPEPTKTEPIEEIEVRPQPNPLSMEEEDALIEDILKNGVRNRHTITEIQPRVGRPSGSITMKTNGGRMEFVAEYPKDMRPSGVLSAPMGDRSVWRFSGTVSLSGYTFEGTDENRPLSFILLDEIGLVHLHGEGKVTFPDGKTVPLGLEGN